jgi:hypothetical protein
MNNTYLWACWQRLDVGVACPLTIRRIMFAFSCLYWGYYLLAWWGAFLFVWANIVTTATSLGFEKPKYTLVWFIVFPFGTLIGLAYFHTIHYGPCFTLTSFAHL